ncbi:MAG: primosomal protein N' [Nitrospirae bacterium]|nr:primosomal protein N' [Nitrospirota bacterium]
MYVDVVFPLKIPPLTYRIPADMPRDLKGRIVKAPLMGRSSYGLIVDVFNKADGPFKKGMKEIQSVHQQCASGTDLQFLKWLSHYYTTPMGIALKSCFFEEIVAALKKYEIAALNPVRYSDVPDSRIAGRPPDDYPGEAAGEKGLSHVCGSIRDRDYRTFLLHAPTAPLEHSLLLEILGNTGAAARGIIILVPEIRQIESLELPLGRMFEQRLCVLHSKLGKGKRTEAVRRLITGESDVVLGTRSAVLAPLRGVSFIAVLGEHSPSYKGEEGLRYNARDVAVMKGFIEKGCVLLSSVCPSTESVYNATISKYTQIAGNRIMPSRTPGPEASHMTGHGRPKIRIINQQGGKHKDLFITEELLKEAKKILSKNEGLLFLINRKGYSLIRCEDCGHIAQCKKCMMSLVFHKGEGRARCHYCGYEEGITDICGECKGTRIKAFGAGTERIKEEVEEMLKTEPLLIEKIKGSPKISSELSPDLSPLIIGTAYAARRIRGGEFSAAAFLNIDVLLAQPDFRAYERAFQEIMHISQMVRPGGTVFLQTRNPGDRVLRLIRNYDFEGFYNYELSQRKALDFPPFSRLILVNIFAKKLAAGLLSEIQTAVAESREEGAEVLGPVEIPSASKSHKYCIQVLIKSKNSKAANATVKGISNKLEKTGGLKVHVDVDPLKI